MIDETKPNPIYAQHPHFMTVIDVLNAQKALADAHRYLVEDMPTLAAATLRLAAKNIADANEKLLGTIVRRVRP